MEGKVYKGYFLRKLAMTETAIKNLRLCGERDNLVNLLKEIGKQHNVEKVVKELSEKYNSPSTVLRYMTRLRNKVSERIKSMKEQSDMPYLESEQFKQDLAEHLNEVYNGASNCRISYSINTKQRKVSFESLYLKEMAALRIELSSQNAKREEFEELVALPSI